MTLPLSPPLLPQLARSAKTLPGGGGWCYEPKWDGFRAIAFVDDGDVVLQSRNGRPLRRYFPELEFPTGRYVLDGEIVILGEAVVQGWRPGKEEGTVGSLILSLYTDDGTLRPVGHTSGFKAAEKRSLVEKLRPYETGKTGMGDPSRWAN